MNAITPASTDLSLLTTLELIRLLQARRIHLDRRGERLKISAPAGVIDPALQAELVRRKQTLLALLEEQETRPALVPLDEEALRGRLPLTAAQQGMWLIDHFDPGNVAYNIPEAFRLEGSASPDLFRAAVDRLIARHRLLRTSFHEEDGELFHLIHPAATAIVDFTDLSAFDEKESDSRCREMIRQEGRRPFDLSKAPLARFHLFRLGQQKHVVLSNLHHIICDRISLYVLRRELIALSTALGKNEEASLPVLALQYAEYAVWSTSMAQRERVKQQVLYWKSKLANLGPAVELPHSLPYPQKRSSWGATHPVLVQKSERMALVKIGMEEGASPFMVFLAVFALLIARIATSGGEDFCIGSPITTRKHPETAEMIGLFVNMLVFRCTIRPSQSFREILRAVRATGLEAYDNSDAPFQSIVKELKLGRRSPRSPIFQVMFGYETFLPAIANELQIDADPGTARYDLSLHLAESESDGLTGCFEYCTDLFTAADIARLASGFQTLVTTVARDAEREALVLQTQPASDSPPLPVP